MEITEGSLVLCTVKKIEKTTIFLEIEGNGEGSMHLSEVAAGRIRNLRDYVFPNKKIVCKVLAIEPGNIQLSLRRVTAKERESVLEHSKKEKRFISMLKVVLPNPEELIRKIRENHDLVDFLEEAHDSPAILEKFFTKNESEKLIKIFSEKAEKEKIIKKLFKLSSFSPNGLADIKEILSLPEAEICYLGSSKFSIQVKAKDFKEANKKLLSLLQQIEKRAKEKHASFEAIEK